MEGREFVGVLVDDDPGRDLGERGHRFFFSPSEVSPLRVLGAGIGTCSSATTGSGARWRARRLARAPTSSTSGSAGWTSRTRSPAMTSVVFLDATPRGQAPGTLYVIEPDLDGLALDVDAHAMHPVSALALAKTLGGELPRTLVLGCEPAGVEEFTDLSEPVLAALEAAEKLLAEVLRKETT